MSGGRRRTEVSLERFAYHLRPVRRGDAAGVARVKVASWRDAYVGILPDRLLIGLDARRETEAAARQIRTARDRNLFVVATADNEVIGFCQGGATRFRNRPREGEIYTAYVEPSFQGIGIGTAMIRHVVSHLAVLGYGSLLIMTLTGNRWARGLYESLGGKATDEIPFVLDGTPTSETAYRWPDIRVALKRLDKAIS